MRKPVVLLLAIVLPLVAIAEIKTELYFGLSKPDGVVTPAEWTNFVESVISPAFADGFTELDGNGKWRDDESGLTLSEECKVIVCIHDGSNEMNASIEDIRQEYLDQFDQQSVLRVDYPVVAMFVAATSDNPNRSTSTAPAIDWHHYVFITVVILLAMFGGYLLGRKFSK